MSSPISDIISAMRDARRAGAEIAHAGNELSHKSIVRGAKDSTMQFPCLVSSTVPIDYASVVAKTMERVYASFVQTYLSANNVMNISDYKDVNQYIQRFHRNVKLESTAVDTYLENCVVPDPDYDKLFERIDNGSTKAYINESTGQILAFNFSDKFNKAVFESNQEQLDVALKDIDFKPIPNVGNSPFYATEAEVDPEYYNKKVLDAQFDRYKQQADRDKEVLKVRINGTKVPEVLKDQDVKKTNDMQPYLMQVRLSAVNDQNEFVQFIDFVLGVKVVLHVVKSDEMAMTLINSMQNKGVLFNFIRWTTGEKSLIKDILLNINDTKLDAANRSLGASPWWTTLKRMKATSKAQMSVMSRTQLVPQTTIVLHSMDVDSIKRSSGYDLHNPKFAVPLMRSLFLMTFIIIDEGTRTVDILYDGSNTFQTYALEALEREITMSSNKIGRELTRMIGH